MSSFPKCLLAILCSLAACGVLAQGSSYPGIGRVATPQEVQAWDIDVRPDFKGLPVGSGSVARGMEVWEAKCASCHGIFGESNEVFSPLTGGTTAADQQTGRVARLNDPGFPGRTTLMKVTQMSTLWDYIRRAMPWNAPKSLSDDDVYAVTAYLLNLGGVLPDNFVLSNTTMAQAQQRLPNRHGATTDHGLWPGKGLGNGGRPDVKAQACMRDCPGPTQVVSQLPEHARNAHGNLLEQNRLVGAQRGADTTQPAGAAPLRVAASVDRAARPSAASAGVMKLMQAHNCLACHGIDRKVVGPALLEVAKKYAGRGDAALYLQGRIRAGGGGVWGAIPMPAQSLPEADAMAIAQWLANGAPR